MIFPRPDAPLGSVTHLAAYGPEDFPADAAVLCRNTAPLVAFAFTALARGVACHVVGKDIQVGLEKLLDKIVPFSSHVLPMRINLHKVNETAKMINKHKRAQQIQDYEDKCSALCSVARHCETIDDIKAKLKTIFANGNGLTLSTVHKAKGLEWDTVFLLDWHLIPSRWVEVPWEKEQERNLQYVAVTRAKTNLRFIKSNQWKSNETNLVQ